MAAPKRTEFEAERDRDLIAKLYLRGVTQQVITDQLNKDFYSERPITRQQIGYDVRLIIDRWVRASINHIDERKAIELAKIDRLENEYWDAWERSRNPAKTELTEGRGTSERASQMKKTVKLEDRDGNPVFLEGVLKCIAKRCDLLGFNAPIKSAITLDVTAMTDEELKQIIDGKLDAK